MTEKELEELRHHVAGAIVKHNSPFAELSSLSNTFELNNDFIDKWVAPFYMKLNEVGQEWENLLIRTKDQINGEIISNCLGSYDWRTRTTGAFFSALTNKPEFIDIIGIHLLKSELTYCGQIYCSVFAFFNTSKCIQFLELYLAYYLTKPDLWFDQRYALEAIKYLDKINSTNKFELYESNWLEFIKNKPYWKKEIDITALEKQLMLIDKVAYHFR